MLIKYHYTNDFHLNCEHREILTATWRNKMQYYEQRMTETNSRC